MSDDYKIKYSSKDQFYVMVVQRLGEWLSQLENVEKKVSVISNMKSFRGRTADSVKSYLNEVHNILLISVRQTILDFQYKVSFFSNDYYNIEPNIYANISSETLRTLKSKVDSEQEYLYGQNTAIQTSLNTISDLSLLKNPSQENILGALSDAAGQVDTLDKNISEYETEKKNEAKGELADLITTLYGAINTYYQMQGQITGYTSGDYSAKTEILDLYNKVTSSMEYTQTNQAAAIEANEHIQEVFAQQQKDYEEACEARKDEGTANFIMGALAVVGGVAAIVLTAGAATPVVVVAAVSGGCATVYGVSNMAEGAQDYYYGSIGDLTTEAWNPIRDTVFCGNQTLYDAWGNLSLTVAGLCVPVNSAVNSVAGASGTVIVKEVGKTVVKETVKGFVIGEVSGQVTNAVAEEFDLNKTETVILNAVLEEGLEKGVDTVEKAYVKHRDGAADGDFTDRMSYDDAKRYNEFMNDPDSYRASMEQVDIKTANVWDGIEDTALKVDTDKPSVLEDHYAGESDADIVNRYNETDPRYINDQVRDYNHPDYIENGTHKIAWGEDSADIPHDETLKPGDVVTRVGDGNGNYLGDENVAYNDRQLPYEEGARPIKKYEVVKELPVEQSTIAQQDWGPEMTDTSAQQYKTGMTIDQLVEEGYLREVPDEQSIVSSDGLDYSKTANTMEEQAILKDMEEKGEFDFGKKSYGAVEVDPLQNVPKEPGRRLPTENTGTIIGDRKSGTFEFVPDDAETQKIMSKYGETTIKYNNDEPSFSPYTKHDSQWGRVECEVEIGHMVGSREGTVDNLGNYQQADIALSQKISFETGQNVTPEQIKNFRETSGLTWHETSDGKTMQLIPTEINANCAHKGGVSAKKYEQAWGDVSLDF